MMDVVIGNFVQINELLINQGDGILFEAFHLPCGGTMTRSVDIVDIDGDAILDIIIGNSLSQVNKLLINEDIYNTFSIAVIDVDSDNEVDILIGKSDYTGISYSSIKEMESIRQ